MSFVPVDNSAGILHNGGQMAWDVVSPGHIVMATITTDYKLLVQEVNFNGTVAVVGTPSFVKQLSGIPSDATKIHFRPRIYSLGDGKILVLAPSSYNRNVSVNLGNFQPVTTAGTGTSESVLTGAGANVVAPSQYSFITMERDGAGNYKITSSMDADTAYTYPNPGAHLCTTFNPLELVSKTATQIVFRRAACYAAVGTGSGYNAAQHITLTLTNGLITSAVPLMVMGNTTNYLTVPFDARTVYTRSRKALTIYAVSSRVYFYGAVDAYLNTDWYTTGNPANTAVASRRLASVAGGVLPPISAVDTKSYVPVSEDGRVCYVIGGAADGGNQALNNSVSSVGKIIYSPLDSAWVTDSVICIAGYQDSLPTGPTFEADATAAIFSGAYGQSRKLSLSFREIAGAGMYASPNDMFETPYYVEQFKNWSNVIHRIDDTHFWLIGCFKADVDAPSKIGVITVSI